jgi:hypothetical protein
LMTWLDDRTLTVGSSLDPTVHVPFAFSPTLGEGIGLVSHLIHSHDCFLVLSHSHPRNRSLPVSVFFSGWVSSKVLIAHPCETQTFMS